MEVEVDDERRSGLLYDAIVANCRYLGGGMAMTPDAEPDDGLLDVLVIGDITRRDLALTLWRYRRNAPPASEGGGAARAPRRRALGDAGAGGADGSSRGRRPRRSRSPPALRLRTPG